MNRDFFSDLSADQMSLSFDLGLAEQAEDSEDAQMLSLFAAVGVEPSELFDLKLARQVGRVFDDTALGVLDDIGL